MLLLELFLVVVVAVLHSRQKRLTQRIKHLEQELEQLRLERTREPQATAPVVEPAAAAVPLAPALPQRPRRSRLMEPAADEESSAPEPEPEREAETLAGLFERLVGGRLLIWAGGVALAVAGIFLVRYSIEIGLVTPQVRMIAAAAFGLLLIGVGEAARRRPGLTPDVRVAQALVGAGILVLYAAAYGSLVLYQLISLAACSALMALITAAALVLSLRHGPPTAVMGLIGGFATPLLVGDPDGGAVPLLAYLGLLDAAIFAIAYRRGWTWLAAAAALLSFAWTASLLAAPRFDAIAAGIFIALLAMLAALLRPGQGKALAWTQPAAVGLLQIAVLVGRTDIDLPAWALFGALAVGTLFLAGRDPRHRPLPALALALALFLLFVKGGIGDDPNLIWVAGAITILFGSAGWRRGEPRLLWSMIGSMALILPALILRGVEPELLAPAGWGVLLLGLAGPPALLAWSHRRHASAEAVDVPLLVPAAAAAAIAMAGLGDLVPLEWLGSGWLAVAIGAALAARAVRDSGLTQLALGVAALAVGAALVAVPELWVALGGSLAGEPALASRLPTPAEVLAGLGAPAVLLAILWRLLPDILPRAGPVPLAVAGLFAACVGYVLFKQLFGLQTQADFVRAGFAERMTITQGLFLAGWLLASERLRLRVLADHQPTIAAVLTAAAAARLVWFDLLLHNPVLAPQEVGHLPLLNLLLPHFIGAAFWLHAARSRAARSGGSGVWTALFLAALIAGTMLLVRQAFQGSLLNTAAMPRGEFYGYSLAALTLSIGLLVAGVRIGDKALRLAGLALLTATALKVFLVDADALEGLLRILSFLGLGIALIGIGKLYGTVLRAERPEPA